MTFLRQGIVALSKQFWSRLKDKVEQCYCACEKWFEPAENNIWSKWCVPATWTNHIHNTQRQKKNVITRLDNKMVWTLALSLLHKRGLISRSIKLSWWEMSRENSSHTGPWKGEKFWMNRIKSNFLHVKRFRDVKIHLGSIAAKHTQFVDFWNLYALWKINFGWCALENDSAGFPASCR